LPATIHRVFRQHLSPSPSPFPTPKSRDSISPSNISCSGLKNKLPGLPVLIEKSAVEGDILPTDEVTDEFGGMLLIKLAYEMGGLGCVVFRREVEVESQNELVVGGDGGGGGGIKKPSCE